MGKTVNLIGNSSGGLFNEGINLVCDRTGKQFRTFFYFLANVEYVGTMKGSFGPRG